MEDFHYEQNGALQAEIARLTRELEEAREQRIAATSELNAMHTKVEQRLYDERDTARRERDEARQALEAERAKAAELEKAGKAALVTLEHARVFIGSRERMHPDGQRLYDKDVGALSRALAAEGGEADGFI